MYTMTEKSVRQIEMPGFSDSMKYLSEHPDKDAEITLHWNTMQDVKHWECIFLLDAYEKKEKEQEERC